MNVCKRCFGTELSPAVAVFWARLAWLYVNLLICFLYIKNHRPLLQLELLFRNGFLSHTQSVGVPQLPSSS